jgi:uncharacterized protein YdcH (DUF465 family)
MITKHQLAIDFPEFAEKIHNLKMENAHFKKLFESYDELDHAIYNVETDTQPKSDDVLNKMRIERVRVKDEIYQFLIHN